MFSVVGWAIAGVVFAVIVYQVLKAVEYLLCIWRMHQIPFVSSDRILRRGVVREIRANYPDVKTVCEIGAGYGSLARYVARHARVHVVAVENMPFTYIIGRVAGMLRWHDVEYVFADAFKYIGDGRRFDVGVAYLGPGVNDSLVRFRHNFRVLITLDVPIDNVVPVRVVDLGRGHTRYGRNKFPHKLFVYEF